MKHLFSTLIFIAAVYASYVSAQSAPEPTLWPAPRVALGAVDR